MSEPQDWAAFNAAGHVYAIGGVEFDPDGSEFRRASPLAAEIRSMPRPEACRLHLAYLATLPEFAELLTCQRPTTIAATA